MSKAKLRFITIFALALLCVFTLGLAIAALPLGRTAYAQTYTPSTIFTGVSDNATDESDAIVGTSAAEGEEDSFVQFTLKTGSRVEYRRDLALKWFVADEENAETQNTPGEGQRVNPGKAVYFSMTFAFGEIEFESFDITFTSAEENVTKDGQTTNVLHFEYKVPEDAEEGAAKVLTVAVRNAEFEEGDADVDPTEITDPTADLTFELIENPAVPGNFNVKLTQGNATEGENIGAFTNIGGYFMEYRSTSATSPQLPMKFEATLPENAASETAQTVLMKSLNGQPLKVDKEGKVEDTAPAVLVINEKIYSFRLGQRFSLSYEAIDVCDSSVTVSNRQFYLLEYEKDTGTEDEGEGETAAEDEEKKPYHKPTDDDYEKLTSSSTFFIPAENDVLEPVLDVNGQPTGEERAYVSIRLQLDDGTSANNIYVYLTWYADPNANVVETKGDAEVKNTTGYKCPVCGKVISEEDHNNAEADATCTGEKDNPDYDEEATEGDAAKKTLPCTGKISEYEKQTETNYFDYIIVDREVKGPHFAGLETHEKGEDDGNGGKYEKNLNVVTDDLKAAIATYQEQVDEAAKKLSAGDGAYFYLPSLETLIQSNYADYRNLRFNIYYFKPSAATGSGSSSATSLRYNNLRFEVDQVGLYTFRVIAQDAAGNMMKYYDEDGELVTVTASNVFEIEGIPEFTFDIGYTGPTIEKPGSQSTAYNKQSYSISSFDVVALEGYDTEYKLYSFAPAGEGQKSYSVEDLVKIFDEVKEDLFNKDNEEHTAGGAKFSELTGRLKEINKYDPNVSEKDAKWEDTDNAYAWDPESSLSFTPQAVGLYVVELEVVDGTYPGLTAHAYKVIEVTNESDILYGSSNWIKNNTTAIILFAISAALLVAIILLLVIKPNEKNLEEVDLSTLKGAKKKTDKPSKK